MANEFINPLHRKSVLNQVPIPYLMRMNEYFLPQIYAHLSLYKSPLFCGLQFLDNMLKKKNGSSNSISFSISVLFTKETQHVDQIN
jgi:hypothetical protein